MASATPVNLVSDDEDDPNHAGEDTNNNTEAESGETRGDVDSGNRDINDAAQSQGIITVIVSRVLRIILMTSISCDD